MGTRDDIFWSVTNDKHANHPYNTKFSRMHMLITHTYNEAVAHAHVSHPYNTKLSPIHTNVTHTHHVPPGPALSIDTLSSPSSNPSSPYPSLVPSVLADGGAAPSPGAADGGGVVSSGAIRAGAGVSAPTGGVSVTAAGAGENVTAAAGPAAAGAAGVATATFIAAPVGVGVAVAAPRALAGGDFVEADEGTL